MIAICERLAFCVSENVLLLNFPSRGERFIVKRDPATGGSTGAESPKGKSICMPELQMTLR